MSRVDFNSYSTPLSSTAYSSQFFAGLTFQQASGLNYPKIAPAGSVVGHVFCDGIPDTQEAMFVLPDEVVPHIDDIIPIIQGAQDAFAEGQHSVCLFMTFGDQPSVGGLYHFSKLQLIKLINNHGDAISKASRLSYHITSYLGLAPDVTEVFDNEPFKSPVAGFHVTDFPLWKLGCFLDEEWLEEDILNAMSELLYFRHSAVQDANFIYLPTSTFNDARQLFQSSNPTYSTDLINLRRRLAQAPIQKIAFSVWHNNHYHGFLYDTSNTSLALVHGDSQHGQPPSDVLPILQWILRGLSYRLPVSIETGAIDLQGFIVGRGSCAIAAYNFVEYRVDKQAPQWFATSSSLFRDKILSDLVIYHCIAVEAKPFHECTQVLIDTQKHSADVAQSGFHGYNDFNLYIPLGNHPIYKFVETCSEMTNVLAPRAPLCDVRFTSQVPRSLIAPLTTEIAPVAKIKVPLGLLCAAAPPSVTMDPPKLLIKPNLGAMPIDLTKSSPPPHESKKHIIKRRRASTSSSEVEILSDAPITAPTGRRQRNTDYQPNRDSSSSPDFDSIRRPSMGTISTPTPRKPPSKKPNIIDLTSSPETKPLRTIRRPQSALGPSSSPIKIIPTNRSNSDSGLQRRAALVTHGQIRVGDIFNTWEEGRDAVYGQEERLGHKWRLGQSKRLADGALKKVTLRCNHYQQHVPVHLPNIDPSDFRNGRSIRTDCEAHVNLNRIQNTDLWHVTTINWDHNHEREIPVGGFAPRPPTVAQRELVTKFASNGKFQRPHITQMLTHNFPGQPLEPRQISNMLNNARRTAQDEVNALGGDVAAIIASLEEKSSHGEGWEWKLKLDENSTVIGLFWQSPLQIELLRRYPDILINDNTANRNRNQYPLNYGIGIDNQGSSRNLWYAFQAREDTEMHNWVNRCHLNSAITPPEVVISDRHGALIASVAETMPLTTHIYCLHHLEGNVTTELRPTLGAQWDDFQRRFWMAYRAVSPDEFDRLWQSLLQVYPTTAQYLSKELYPSRKKWAWAWISTIFTAGVRTNGRIESENRVNKTLGGPKQTLLGLFNNLNERTDGQTAKEMTQVRMSSRMQHNTHLESVFRHVLKILRQYAGPYALQVSWKQMQESVFYKTEVVQLPDGVRSWNEYVVGISTEVGFAWADSEEMHMHNRFDNDQAYISTKWLIRQVADRGLTVVQLLRITHLSGGQPHYLALLSDGTYVCDCCMGMNLGLPCRHYFQAFTTVPDLHFNISLVRARWYQNPNTDASAAPRCTFTEMVQPAAAPQAGISRPNPTNLARGVPLPSPINLRDIHTRTPSPETKTLDARTVHFEAQARMRMLTNKAQTQEQLDDLLERLDDLGEELEDEAQRGIIRDPAIVRTRGRPRTARITGPLEGRPRGGGARPRKCGNCHREGHYRTKCPLASQQDGYR